MRWAQAARISLLGTRSFGKLVLKPLAASRTKFAYVAYVCVLNEVSRVDACDLDVCDAVVFSVFLVGLQKKYEGHCRDGEDRGSQWTLSPLT